jgi:molybdopterin-guanine dinucleotide biosynthesis protein A
MRTAAEISSITGLILAGGRASRMHNVDKGLQRLNGKPLVEHVIERVKPQVSALAINANRNLEDYQQYGLPVWPDADLPKSIDTYAFKGPLAGLETGAVKLPIC